MGNGTNRDPNDDIARKTLGQLVDPLEFIARDHRAERVVCDHLDRLAAGDRLRRADIESALRFLRDDLPHHLDDEELDLFPVLRRRCEADDEIDKAIARLTSDHAHAAVDTPTVIAVLDGQLRKKRPLSDTECHSLSAYAAHARRHLTLENAVVLPLARLRLSKKDQTQMAARMAQRRGLGSNQE
jgi:hemerythrin-like domain-containing protein